MIEIIKDIALLVELLVIVYLTFRSKDWLQDSNRSFTNSLHNVQNSLYNRLSDVDMNICRLNEESRATELRSKESVRICTDIEKTLRSYFVFLEDIRDKVDLLEPGKEFKVKLPPKTKEKERIATAEKHKRDKEKA